MSDDHHRRPGAPIRPPSIDSAAASGRRRVAVRLSAVTLLALVAASLLGLVLDGVYGRPESTASMLRGYDLVTLAVAAPLLGWALWRQRARSIVAELVWVAMLAYAVYDYAIYLFGTGFNDLFLLHVTAFGTAAVALPLALSTLPVDTLPARCAPRTPTRAVAALLALLAVALGAMWVVDSLQFAVTDELPTGSALVETPAVVHLGMALDLALLVPGYATAAWLLWRRTGWGFVVAAMLLASGAVHQIGYLVALPFQVAADVPGATAFDAAEPFIAAAFIAAAVTLLAGLRRSSDNLPGEIDERPAS